MKLCEINSIYYCTSGSYRSEDGYCNDEDSDMPCEAYGESCPCRHRKHPTPEQFKEEYGFEWEGAYYIHHEDADGWCVSAFNRLDLPCVCACTPFIPANDWRPQ